MNALLVAASLVLVCCVCGTVGETNKTEPPVLMYIVKDNKTDHNCLLLQAGIRLHFNYSVNSTHNETFQLDVPHDANRTSSGSCGSKQTLNIFMNDDSQLSFVFNKTGQSQKDAALEEVRFMFNMSLFPNADGNKTYTAVLKNQHLFECPAGKGFLCMSNKSISFDNSTPLVSLDTVHLRVEAFRSDNKTVFGSDYTQCNEDNNTSKIIPIAVGAALGALIFVVLIAYLVGRKRSQRAGYETV